MLTLDGIKNVPEMPCGMQSEVFLRLFPPVGRVRFAAVRGTLGTEWLERTIEKMRAVSGRRLI